MEAPKFYHNGKLVHYISHMPVVSIVDDPVKFAWRTHNDVSDADVIRHFGQYSDRRRVVHSLQGVIDLGNDQQPDIGWHVGCLLADYDGNIYFAGINPWCWIRQDNTLIDQCDKKHKLILQQMYTLALFYLEALELGDVTQVIKQYILQMLSYDIHYRRESINWHRK
jgi:hypothetical protein